MKYLGKITDKKDLVTKEYVDNKVVTYSAGEGITIAADGTISINAARVYSGASEPDNSLGENGDIYLQMGG